MKKIFLYSYQHYKKRLFLLIFLIIMFIVALVSVVLQKNGNSDFKSSLVVNMNVLGKQMEVGIIGRTPYHIFVKSINPNIRIDDHTIGSIDFYVSKSDYDSLSDKDNLAVKLSGNGKHILSVSLLNQSGESVKEIHYISEWKKY